MRFLLHLYVCESVKWRFVGNGSMSLFLVMCSALAVRALDSGQLDMLLPMERYIKLYHKTNPLYKRWLMEVEKDCKFFC